MSPDPRRHQPQRTPTPQQRANAERIARNIVRPIGDMVKKATKDLVKKPAIPPGAFDGIKGNR